MPAVCESTPPSLASASVRLPRRLGDFIPRKRIGKGGRSHVFLARQAILGRSVALKVLRPEFAAQAAVVAAFQAEAAAYGRCDHPHILSCYAAGQEGDWHFMALSHAAQGDALRALRGSSRAEQLPRILLWMTQIAEALAYIHAQGLVHGDVKPANILIADDDRALLADLGSLQSVRGPGAGQRWEGTPGYMSPEHAQRQALNERCDIFALGATAWHLCAGRAPRPATGDQNETLRQAVDEPMPSLASVAPWVPSSVVALIERCLHPDPAQRLARAEALASSLRQVRESLLSDGQDQHTSVALHMSF